MFKSLRVTTLILALVFALSIGQAKAQSRYSKPWSQPIETSGIFTDNDGNTMDYPVWIYGIKIYADASSSFMGIYDCDTTYELLHQGTVTAKDEIGEATQYDTATEYYSDPLYFSDGVGAIISTGVGFVKYGPEPTR